MKPKPVFDYPSIHGADKLRGKIAFITGADSGIGRAVAVLFAKEGADIVIGYLNETADANETRRIIAGQYGRRCLLIKADLSKEKACNETVRQIIKKWGRIDILVNNAAIHFENKKLEQLKTRQLIKTFETNIFSYFWVTKAALPYLRKGACTINSSSVTAYRGSAVLMDYAATKGAIVSFTRSLSANLAKKGIRVNGVAPGPVWTPLIPSSFAGKKAAKHGSDAPIGRAATQVI